ncbi:MAG: hypothetical protein L3J74_11915 [Bacteroidales bacterium]|nr:hypothetical protein [Bacteroidales bacterium]
MQLRIFLFLVFGILFSVVNDKLPAQEFYRFRADYTIKINQPAGKPLMKMGTVFYDKNSKKIVIKNGFPIKENIIHYDSSVYFVRVGRVVKHNPNLLPVEFSIFHLALNGNLPNYGLDKAGWVLEDVKKDKGLLIASWIPLNDNQKGKTLIATKNKELYSIIFLDKNEEILSKYIFHKYTNIKGLSFPTEIVRIYYKNGKELYELSSYRNIKINENGNDEYYDYQIPE